MEIFFAKITIIIKTKTVAMRNGDVDDVEDEEDEEDGRMMLG